MKSINEIKAKLTELAAGREVVKFDTTYGTLHAVKNSDLRLEHYSKSPDYNFAMITQANAILFEAQL